jgi:hypothetical protein
MSDGLQGEEVKRVASSLLLAFTTSVSLTSCGFSGQQMGSDVTLACTMFENPDEYRVNVLASLSQNNDPFVTIDVLVRQLSYPGVTDSSEATDIKSKFAKSLDAFAAAYLQEDRVTRLQASNDLTNVSQELRDRCSALGYQFTEQWQGQ